MNVHEFPLMSASSHTFNIMLGMGMLLLLIYLALEIMQKCDGLKNTKQEWRYGTPFYERPDEKVTDASTAVWLWQQSGISCTLRMLESLETSLKRAGYGLTREKVGPDEYVPGVGDMNPHLRDQVIADLIRAREHFWAPQQSDEEVAAAVRLALTSGHGQWILDDVISNLKKRGFWLRKITSGHALAAYPLKQVIIDLEADPDTAFSDIAYALNRLEKCVHFVGDNGLEKGGFDQGGVSGDASSPVRYSIQCRTCKEPPGFFPERCGFALPPLLSGMKVATQDKTGTVIRILLQGRHETSTDALTRLLQDAVFKVVCGAREHADFDEDVGYAFYVHDPDVRVNPEPSITHP